MAPGLGGSESRSSSRGGGSGSGGSSPRSSSPPPPPNAATPGGVQLVVCGTSGDNIGIEVSGKHEQPASPSSRPPPAPASTSPRYGRSVWRKVRASVHMPAMPQAVGKWPTIKKLFGDL